jgi:hypothetical protein
MVTPKTDIEQSIGRILRERHSEPIVVDIVDTHELFKNQWRKRKTFYKKENYKIIYTDSSCYSPSANNWKTIFLPICKENGKTNVIKKNNNKSHVILEEEEEQELEEEQDEPTDNFSGKCLLKFNK